jgi:predicted small lipoprotein YifL
MIRALAAAAALAALLAAGCGQKGPLKLPETPPAQPAPPK